VCGRFARFAGRASLEELFGIPLLLPALPRFNVAPGQPALAVRRDDAGRHAFAELQWGFNLQRADGRRSLLVNARSESVAAKPAFQDSFRRRRCLIPADGFFEWSPGPAKRPFFIHRGDHRCLALAGLWRLERDRGGDGGPHFTILTRDADAALQTIHDRMPVIVPRETFETWLDGSAADAANLLAGLPEAPLVATPVGRRVNDPGHDDPGCIVAVPDPREAGPATRLPGI
jgi:putative SOS response-associated peptidase YedK